jgi:hypothetical protein
MRTRIPSEKAITEGIIGQGFNGTSFISQVKGKYYTGNAIFKPGGVPLYLKEVKEQKGFKEAIEEIIEMHNI